MRALLPLLAPLVLLTACGPREPGPRPNEWLFLRVTSYEREMGQCSDHQEMKAGFDAVFPTIPSDGTAFFAIQVDGEGGGAQLMRTCARLEADACQPFDPPLLLSVTGHELFLGENVVAENPSPSGCRVALARAWVFTDQGETWESIRTSTFSLVGPQAACAEEDANLKRLSPNGFGLEGCTVVEHISGRLN